MSHELLELLLLGVDVWIIKLEIWVIIELLLNDHLLNLLTIVLFLECLLYVPVPLFFLLLQDEACDSGKVLVHYIFNVSDSLLQKVLEHKW